MKRAHKKKLSPLDRRLEHHDRLCSRFVYSDPDRMSKCSCGRDAAVIELAELRKRAEVKPLSHFVPTDFNHDSLCGLTKSEWKGGTNNWEWVNCPKCLERRPVEIAEAISG